MYEFLEKMAAKKEKNNTLKELGIAGETAAGTGLGGYGLYRGIKSQVNRRNWMNAKAEQAGRIPKERLGEDLAKKVERLKKSKIRGFYNGMANNKVLNNIFHNKAVNKVVETLGKGNRKYYSLGALALLAGLGAYGGRYLHNKKKNK